MVFLDVEDDGSSPAAIESPRNNMPVDELTSSAVKRRVPIKLESDRKRGDVQSIAKVEVPRVCGVPMKWISLVALTLQTSAQVFVIKWASAGATGKVGGEPLYLASTVVLFTEVVKTSVSFVLMVFEAGGLLAGLQTLCTHCLTLEALKVTIPSLLYTVQNNLMFFSLSKLSMAVQQVTYQLKILTTAVLSVLILGKVLDRSKWGSLLVLLIGVMLLQFPRQSGETPAASSTFDAALGFMAVLAACITSGLASVYLEKILKQTSASIWVRNVQLGYFGILMAALVAFSKDGHQIKMGGFLQGYSVRVWGTVLNNALGGLLCAAVLKYADNILRCFSTALSIILTSVLSAVVLHDMEPDAFFIIGAILAIFATFVYNVGLYDLITNMRRVTTTGIA